jgi:hypothetical protein
MGQIGAQPIPYDELSTWRFDVPNLKVTVDGVPWDEGVEYELTKDGRFQFKVVPTVGATILFEGVGSIAKDAGGFIVLAPEVERPKVVKWKRVGNIEEVAGWVSIR